MRIPQKFPLPKREFVFWGPQRQTRGHSDALSKNALGAKLLTPRQTRGRPEALCKNPESGELHILSIPLSGNRESRKSDTISPPSGFP